MAVLPHPTPPKSVFLIHSLASAMKGFLSVLLFRVWKSIYLSGNSPVFTPVPGLFFTWNLICCLRFGPNFLLLFWIMDSNDTAATPSGKIRRCPCGRRMSSLQHDFHSVCIVCRGVDCDTDHRCPECNDISDLLMTNSTLNISSAFSISCRANGR